MIEISISDTCFHLFLLSLLELQIHHWVERIMISHNMLVYTITNIIVGNGCPNTVHCPEILPCT